MRINRSVKVIIYAVVIAAIAMFLLLKIFNLTWVPKALFEATLAPKKAIQAFESGRYGPWDWTPDGKIIYVKGITMMSHVKSAGPMGYTQEWAKTVIAVIDKDGTNNRVIKEIEYLPKMAKRNKRYTDLEQEERKGKTWIEWFFFSPPRTVNVEKEVSDGTIDKIYPDPPLAHIRSWIDWNGRNNKLVFVANDSNGREGIAISDPEFKDVKWINYEGIFPRWSPDGTKIAFIKKTWKDGHPFDYGNIWTMDLDGKNEQQVSNDSWFDYFCWFPDGKEILGDNVKKENSGTVRLNLSNGDMNNIGSAGTPSISPNEKWVIHNQGIMNLETGEKRKFTHSLGFPKWSPNGKHIIEGWEGGVAIFDFENNRVVNLRSVTPGQKIDLNIIANFARGQ